MVSPWMQHGTIMSHMASNGGPLAVNVDRFVRLLTRIYMVYFLPSPWLAPRNCPRLAISPLS